MKTPTDQELQAMRDRLEIRGSSVWWKADSYMGRKGLLKPAGTVKPKGYVEIQMTVDRGLQSWKAQRVAYFLHYGVWPTLFVDHKDQNPRNNNPLNLRQATRSQNNQNVGTRADNTTGAKGVTYHKQSSKYQATLNVDKKNIQKRFHTMQEAVEYRKYLEEKHHPFAPTK